MDYAENWSKSSTHPPNANHPEEIVEEVKLVPSLLLLQLRHGEEGGEEEHLGQLGQDVHQAGLAHLKTIDKKGSQCCIITFQNAPYSARPEYL